MPYDANNIDYVCTDCGYVREGPHAGEHIPDPQHKSEYKGAGLSHSWGDACPECKASGQADKYKRGGHSDEARERARRQAEDAETVRKGRAVQRQAEDAASSHWWWRKMGKQE